ncbi:MAG: hypothetical protein EHM61_19020 [Acidobacteria bacterium]|nr:MAG: hypothetical protein EHM61_19020 [Acidobacteriota bacterium]
MTKNDQDRRLPRLERAIELEKQEALEYFRTDIAELRLRAAIARRDGRASMPRLWAIPVFASGVVVFGLLLIFANFPAGTAEPLLQTDVVETALLLHEPHAGDHRVDPPCLARACRTQSDRTWAIEAAIYRSRRRHIPDQDVGKLILTSLTVKQPPFPGRDEVSDEFVRRLGSRIRQTRIESALARRRGPAGGS